MPHLSLPLLSFQQNPEDFLPSSGDRVPRCLSSLPALLTQMCPTCCCGSYYGLCDLSDRQPSPLLRTARLSPPFCTPPHFPNKARQKPASLSSTSLSWHMLWSDQAPGFVTQTLQGWSSQALIGTVDIFVCLFPF